MLSQTTEKRLEGMKNDLLSLSQASKMYDVSKVTLKKWEEIGLIKPITLGSRNKYLSKEAMDKLLDSKITFDEQKLQDYKKEIHNEMKEYSDRLRDLKIQRNIIGEFEAKKYRDILLKIFTTLNPGVDCPPDQYDTMLQFLSGKSIVDLARESKVTSPAIVYKINSSLKMLDEFCKTVRKSEDTFKENEELLRQNDRLKKKIEMLEAGAGIAGNRGVSRKNPIDVLNLNIRKENTRLNNILSTRCLNALSYLNIVTVGELSKMKKLTLQLTPGVGKGSLNQIEKFLSKYGLELE